MVFPQFNNRRLKGTVSATGRSFYVQKDAQSQSAGAQAIANNRVFKVTVDLEIPSDLQNTLVPGTKGQLVLEAAP